MNWIENAMMPPQHIFDGCDATGSITDGFSLEATVRDIEGLRDVASQIPAGTVIAIPCLAQDKVRSRVEVTQMVRDLGFAPMPHLSARRVASTAELEEFLTRSIDLARVDRCLVVAGDAAAPMGPFADSAAMIESGILERVGIKIVGVSGHPEGHPVMSEAQCWSVLESKCRQIVHRRMTPTIVTQFAFDEDCILSWLSTLRARGIEHPVRIGVPGPASISTLTRFAVRCGIEASASVLTKHGKSLGKLLGTGGPDRFVRRLEAGLGKEHGAVRLHFYPFGGIAPTIDWIERYRGQQFRLGQQ